MLETIFTWLTQALGESIEALTKWFCSSMELSLDQVVEAFPFFAIAYEIFQGIGIGLVLAIGAVALAKFFLGSLEESFDTPWQVLFRAVIAVGLIYLGGYLVTWLVNLAKLPYDRMNSLDAIMWGYDNTGQIAAAYGFDTLATIDASSILGVDIGGAAMALLRFLGALIISINLIKLMIEVAERYMVVAFVAYSAPLVFSTYASSATADILKKWINMLISQCILMTLSVWSFKIVLSGFAISTDMDFGEYLLHFFMSLAACKVAQKLDDYLQRLGLNTVHTGGSLLDSALGTLGAYFAVKGGRSGGNSILGSYGSNGKDSGYGLRGMVSRFAEARGAGATGREAFKASFGNPAAWRDFTAYGRAYNRGQENVANAAGAVNENNRNRRNTDGGTNESGSSDNNGGGSNDGRSDAGMATDAMRAQADGLREAPASARAVRNEDGSFHIETYTGADRTDHANSPEFYGINATVGADGVMQLAEGGDSGARVGMMTSMANGDMDEATSQVWSNTFDSMDTAERASVISNIGQAGYESNISGGSISGFSEGAQAAQLNGFSYSNTDDSWNGGLFDDNASPETSASIDDVFYMSAGNGREQWLETENPAVQALDDRWIQSGDSRWRLDLGRTSDSGAVFSTVDSHPWENENGGSPSDGIQVGNYWFRI